MLLITREVMKRHLRTEFDAANLLRGAHDLIFQIAVRLDRHVFRTGCARKLQAVSGHEARLVSGFLNLIVECRNAIGIDKDRTIYEESLAFALFSVCLVPEHQKHGCSSE